MTSTMTSKRARGVFAVARFACAAMLVFGLGVERAAASKETSTASESRSAESCLCEKDRAALYELRDRVAGAPTVEEARALASGSVTKARSALGRARLVAFLDRGTLDTAYQRLVTYESSVAAAPTLEAVLAEFDALMLKRPGNAQGDIEIDTDGGGCDYSTGEVLAVILGLVLGIIPGLILLVLLC